MLKKMTMKEVRDVVSIHESSWAPHEISVKLGQEYLHSFYTHVVQSPYSFGYVYTYGNTVLSYAVGFHDYQMFNDYLKGKIRFRLGIIILKRLLSRKIGWADISNLLNDGEKLRKARYPKYHLGALALAKEYRGTPLGREAIMGAIEGVLREFEDKGYPGCWGLCDYINTPMRKCLTRLKFIEVDIINFGNRSVVLYERDLVDKDV